MVLPIVRVSVAYLPEAVVPSPYLTEKDSSSAVKVEDLDEEKVPLLLHGSPWLVHKSESGVLTHRSLLPVSRAARRLCGGVPSVKLI